MYRAEHKVSAVQDGLGWGSVQFFNQDGRGTHWLAAVSPDRPQGKERAIANWIQFYSALQLPAEILPQLEFLPSTPIAEQQCVSFSREWDQPSLAFEKHTSCTWEADGVDVKGSLQPQQSAGFHSSRQLGTVVSPVKETPLPEAMAFRCKGDTPWRGEEGMCMNRSQLICTNKDYQFPFFSPLLVSLFDANGLEGY